MNSSYSTHNFDEACFGIVNPASQQAEEHLAFQATTPTPILSTPVDLVRQDFAFNDASAEQIPIEWLNSKNNWPKHAEEKLKKFMFKNDFYNYKKTDSGCIKRLDEIADELRGLFFCTNWTKLHQENLKEKIKRKMHRIRKEEGGVNLLREWRKITDCLNPTDLPEAMDYLQHILDRTNG